MAAIIGSLRAELSAAIASFQDDMGKASKQVKKFADDFAKAGQGMQRAGAALSLAITAPFVLFAKESTDAARDAEELQSKFNYVFAGMRREMNAWAEDTGDAMGRSTQTMQQLSSTFGLLFNKAAPTADVAAGLSKDFSQLALDLGSFYNVAEGDALEKLRAGLVGEAEPLRAFGVFLNAADTEARALAMGLAATSKELTEQDKILARAAIIMDQTKVAQGDLARTADSAANQQRRLKEEMEELGVQVGQMLLPLLTDLVGMLTDAVAWFKDLDPAMQQTIGTVALVAAALGPLLIILGSIATGISAIIRLTPAIVGGFTAIKGAALGAGTALGVVARGFAALAAAPLVFEGGKKIGQELGHQIGLMQAMVTYGLSYDEAVRKFEEGSAKMAAAAKATADAETEAREFRASVDAAIEEAAAEHQENIAREAQEAEVAAAEATAAERIRIEQEKQAALAALREMEELESDNADEIARMQAEWSDAFDEMWNLGEHAENPLDSMEVSLDGVADGIDIVGQTIDNLPDFEVGMDMTNINAGIDDAVYGMGQLALYGGDAGEMIKRLIMQFVEMTFLAPAMASLSKILKDIAGNAMGGAGFQSGGGGGGIGGWLNGVGQGIGDWVSQSFGGFFADGGTLKRGSWGVVGERGPEPVFAGTSDLEIFPNDGGGGGVANAFYITTPDADSFRRSERQIARDYARAMEVRN